MVAAGERSEGAPLRRSRRSTEADRPAAEQPDNLAAAAFGRLRRASVARFRVFDAPVWRQSDAIPALSAPPSTRTGYYRAFRC